MKHLRFGDLTSLGRVPTHVLLWLFYRDRLGKIIIMKKCTGQLSSTANKTNFKDLHKYS